MDIKDFSFGCRFTDEKFAMFSESELSEMEVLSKEEADSIWSEYCDNDAIPLSSFAVNGKGLGNLTVLIEDCGWGDEVSERETTLLLKSSLEKSINGCVYVCYYRKEAVKVTVNLFCERWFDFCYPSDYLLIHYGERALLYYEDCIFLLYKRI